MNHDVIGPKIFLESRFWAALTPVIVIVAGAFGIQLADGVLADTGDRVVAGFMSALALWNLLFAKQTASKNKSR